MKLIKKNSNKKGFTLVELVIVIAILAILALILVPAVAKYIGNADTAKHEAAVRTIYTNAVSEFGIIDAINDDKAKVAANLVGETSNIKTDETITIHYTGNAVNAVVYTVSGKTYSFDGRDILNSEPAAESIKGSKEVSPGEIPVVPEG